LVGTYRELGKIRGGNLLDILSVSHAGEHGSRDGGGNGVELHCDDEASELVGADMPERSAQRNWKKLKPDRFNGKAYDDGEGREEWGEKRARPESWRGARGEERSTVNQRR
jgi:hypothetical protein